jgi:hypothetical protein
MAMGDLVFRSAESMIFFARQKLETLLLKAQKLVWDMRS